MDSGESSDNFAKKSPRDRSKGKLPIFPKRMSDVSNEEPNEDADSQQLIDNIMSKSPVITIDISNTYAMVREIKALFPILEKQLVNMYGIIRYLSEGQLTIMDETESKFKIHISLRRNHDSEPLIPFKAGDIIRMHRVALIPGGLIRNTSLKNVVIFESFGQNKLQAWTIAEKTTYHDYDATRVAQLTQVNIENLLENPMTTCFNSYDTVQAAFQVFAVIELKTRVVICCWLPGPITESYPCTPFAIDSKSLIQKVMDCRAYHPYTESYLQKLYSQNQLVFISVYGCHRPAALELKTMDTFVVFNLVRKADRLYPGHFCYLIFDGLNFGRCIRKADWNSEIAVALRSKAVDHFEKS